MLITSNVNLTRNSYRYMLEIEDFVGVMLFSQ